MKNVRKLFAVALAVMMIMSLAIAASAEETKYTLTLNKALEGHTYTAYQIFAGDLSGETLSNITWGSGVTADGQTALGDAADKAATLTSVAAAEAFAAEVAPYLGTAAGSATVAEGATSCEITGLAAGYYLIETTKTTDENGVKTYYIMKVVANTEADVKADAPEVTKTVDKIDVSIGDTVTFTLTATMPANLQGYDTYQIVFHDTLSAGLSYVAVSTVTVAGTEVTTGYNAVHENGALTITFADVLAQNATASSQIVVTYTATVNENAVIGTEGNPNTVKLQYSNDPNWNGEGTEPTGMTPETVVKVYTWKLPVFKYTGTDTPLAGAGFTLYTDAECTQSVNLVAVEGTTEFKACTAAGCTHTHVTNNEIKTDETGRFTIKGLAQGTYYLKETTTPAGYNTCDVVTVTIGENGALTQNGTATDEVAIQNNSGTTLPSTGGIGTTLFYIIGSVLLVGAVVLLVTKRRMNTAE